MSSPNTHIFIEIPIIEKKYKKVDPVILSTPLNDMQFTKNIIMIYQYPPQDKLFVPTYISSDYQTHYGIYKLENGELKLLFQKLQIVFDGLVYYYLERDITNFLYNLGLNKNEIENIKNTKYKLEVIDL
jgi:hypothetical protein